MANPSSKWDFVPVYGVYLKVDDTPSAGQVSFILNQRVTRVDGRIIYPDGASIAVTIGNSTQQDATVRNAVRTAWRAADSALPGFSGTAWDIWWDSVVVPASIFTSFPASDDTDIVQKGYSVLVREQLQSGGGKQYGIQPLLAHLDLAIPGLNLGVVEVPPGSPSAPPAMYAKGVPGGVAALNYNGDVVDADGVVVGGGGTALTGYVSQVESLPDYPATFPPATHTHLISGVTSLQTTLDGKAAAVHTHAISDTTGLLTALAGKADTGHVHTASQVTDFVEAAQDAVNSLLVGASGVTLAYNDAANTLTITGGGSGGTVDAEQVRDLMGVALVAAGNISIVVNDAADTITISTTATVNATDAALRDRSTHTGTQTASSVSDFTEAAQDAAAAFLVAGSGVTLTHDDTANTLTITAPGDSMVWRYSGGAYPALPTTRPAGVNEVQARGPVYPTSIPAWCGLSSGQALLSYSKLALA